MKTMLIEDGDLVVGASSDYQMVTDSPKVRQDVRHALLEPLGNDRFHPGWGSSIESFVGQTVDDYTQTAVISEVNRVVGNYAAVQRDRVETDVLSESTTRYSTDEIVSAVSGVDVRANLDSLSVAITISTVSGSSVTINEAL